MKVMKLALLGAAAVAAVSVSARADDLSDLKAQIEALNGRISQLESAPAVPAGYQLMTLTEAPKILAPGVELDNEMPTVKTIGILPTADVPASTNIQWDGYVRAAIYYAEDRSYSDDAYDDADVVFKSRARLNLTATTDTAVGEVGAFIRFEVNSEGHFLNAAGISSDGDGYSGTAEIIRWYGWWKITPEVSLLGGYTESIGKVALGMGACTCNYVGYVGTTEGQDDSTQFQLRYDSGPISAAIAVENHDTTDEDSDYAVAASLAWKGDTVSGKIAGVVTEEDGLGSDDTAWEVGAGITFGLDMITVTAMAGLGEDLQYADSYWVASILASAALSESVTLEVGAGIASPDGDDNDEYSVYGAAYWSPVSQLSIGAEVAWGKNEADDDGAIEAALVTVFSF